MVTEEGGKKRLRALKPMQSMSAINNVIRVMYGYKKPVMYKDITSAAGIHPVNVSQALSSSRDIGLTETAGKKGLYDLTERGREYVMLLSAGKEEEAKRTLREIIRGNPLWDDTIAFLNATRGQSRDPIDLVLDIERKSDKQWKQGMRQKISDSIVSILDFAEMIVKEGGKIIPVKKKQTMQVGDPEINVPEELTDRPKFIPFPTPRYAEDSFAMLRGDDFTFEVRKDLDAITFAKKQFEDWIEYLKKNLQKKEQESRQSGGVPNQTE